ncbi:MAG TPA: CDP-alcohol phosphatidyltransferase family protein [Candidatus Avipropionibacterium avicola]|uniref:Phosphatidylinositol phosphate synthase n=1 Tax=Candidatus Avipropionibacterium avicola TaxID=2840701 RepID=A0A9D1GVJ4_9ACTN|nr:CDP-alcohol phosphatidyltransferase family protein [Candidatus Avipropionibacterium avicola]
MVERLRDVVARLLSPPARLLIRLGVSADVITWMGTVLVVGVAAVFIPLGWLWQAALVLAVISFADMLDGQIARLSGHSTRWGAFLDSSLDRIGDGAVFGAITVWFALAGQPLLAGLAVAALVLGQVTSYVKARAESHGWTVSGGLAARADRLAIAYLGLLGQGLGLGWALGAAMAVLTVLSAITVVQRFAQVHRQARHPQPADDELVR